LIVQSALGQRVKRLDAPQKLTGHERFVGDLSLPGMLYARPVTSPYAHALIKRVDTRRALALPGVVAVLTGDDLPFAADFNAEAKSPIARGEVVFAGQFVALVLAESATQAEDAVALVAVEYEPLPVVAALAEALDPCAPHVRQTTSAGDDDEGAMHSADAATTEEEDDDEPLPPNISQTVRFRRGDLAAGLAAAAEVVNLSFETHGVHQGYIEPLSCLVTPDPLGGVTVYASTQTIFHCRSRVAEALGLPVHQVRVESMAVGGGFGGKFVYVEPMVAAAAVAIKRPVLLQYTRMEDLLAGAPAPECRIHIQLAATHDGMITALRARLEFNSGASSASPLQVAAVLIGGCYRFPALDIRGIEALSHRAAAGAYRAPGAQQATFAIESAIDELARKLALDPLEFRLRNCVIEGDERPNGKPWPRIGMRECLEAIQAHPIWTGRDLTAASGRGVGIAVGGWPGGIEPATAVCRLDADGRLTVVVGSVDLSGTNTGFAQIAGDVFGLPPEAVHVTTAASDSAPHAGASGGSKITYTVGTAVYKAAIDAREQVLAIAAQHLEAAPDDLEIVEGTVRVKGVPNAAMPLRQIAAMSMSFGAMYEPVFGRGSTAITEGSAGFAAHLCEVEVDDQTGEVRIIRYVAAQDVGFALNPAAIEGQIHGGVAQGIGWALYEQMVYDNDGQLLTSTLQDYALPKATMIPPVETILVEVPSEDGAFGVRGVGEPPAIPGPAAIANAVAAATGCRLTRLPITPEAIALRRAS
jgi:CO/xanthine dehydrogenase Mo-binding subunit